jgi:hypothetical protein
MSVIVDAVADGSFLSPTTSTPSPSPPPMPSSQHTDMTRVHEEAVSEDAVDVPTTVTTPRPDDEDADTAEPTARRSAAPAGSRDDAIDHGSMQDSKWSDEDEEDRPTSPVDSAARYPRRARIQRAKPVNSDTDAAESSQGRKTESSAVVEAQIVDDAADEEMNQIDESQPQEAEEEVEEANEDTRTPQEIADDMYATVMLKVINAKRRRSKVRPSRHTRITRMSSAVCLQLTVYALTRTWS